MMWSRALQRAYGVPYFVSDVIAKSMSLLLSDSFIPELEEETVPLDTNAKTHKVECPREAISMIRRFIRTHNDTYNYAPTEDQVVGLALKCLEMVELEAAVHFRMERRIRRNAADVSPALGDNDIERLIVEALGRKPIYDLSAEIRQATALNVMGKGMDSDDIIYLPEPLCYLLPDLDISIARLFLYVSKLLKPFIKCGDYKDYVGPDGTMKLFIPYSIFPVGSYLSYATALKDASGKKYRLNLTNGESFVLMCDYEKTEMGFFASIDTSFLRLFFADPPVFFTCRWSEVRTFKIPLYVFLNVFLFNVEHGFTISENAFKLMLRADRDIYYYPSHFIFHRVRALKDALDRCSTVSFDYTYSKGYFYVWPVRKEVVKGKP